MVYGCGNKCVKYSVLVVNLLVCIVGAVILAVSLALAFSGKFSDFFAEDIVKQVNVTGDTFSSMKAVLYFTAAIGALIFVTGFLGCCGAGCESPCLLTLFFIITLILFLAELGIGIAAIVLESKGELEDDVDTYYSQHVIPSYIEQCDDLNSALKQGWEKVESDHHCCGCNGPKDYVQYNSTCALAKCINSGNETTTTYWNEGCCKVLWDDLSNNLIIVGGVAIGLLVIELLAMIFTCCLKSAIRDKDYRHYA